MKINKKKYDKPVINRIEVDNSISLNMLSGFDPGDPRDPPPAKSTDPFESPFDDKTFG